MIGLWRQPTAALLTVTLLAGTLGAPAVVAAQSAGALATDAPALERLEHAAAAYRDIASRGGWPRFDEGPTIRPGDGDRRIPALRQLLTLTGDLAVDASAASDALTPEVAAALRRFQSRHGLAPDAVIGRNTQAALAVSAADRAGTLALNIERLRDLSRRLPRRALIVNVPAFTLTHLSDGRPEWQTRVIVGRPSWQTPLFESAIGRVELNPYWNVPPSIARRELVPKIAADPGYLAKHDMRILQGPAGHAVEVAPDSVDWRRFSASGFRLRQEPGPLNPLGQVKFFLPNPYGVYLHDTPEKALFQRETRALSHGCVRVENAMELAARLLQDEPGWSAERLASEAATGRNLQIPLSKPVPVAFIYVTGWVDPEGLVQFRSDLYRRDPAVILAARPESCAPPPAALAQRGSAP